MGLLIEMPVRSDVVASLDAETIRRMTETDNHQELPVEAIEAVSNESEKTAESSIDFSIWMNAPKERTSAYFPTYSAISRAMQTALRSWVREWFQANPEILLRPHSAYPILVFQCTHPFAGRPTNTFTYDIQQTEALNRAFRSAAKKLGGELKALNTNQFPWLTREHYFAYRSMEVVKYVMKNRRAIYKMLNVETVLMDSILKFALIDIPKMGLENAVVVLRRAFNTQLRRFSEEIDFTGRAEELLKIATETLGAKMAEPPVMPAPRQSKKVVAMPVRQASEVFELPLAA